jgi:hypothetical protein
VWPSNRNHNTIAVGIASSLASLGQNGGVAAKQVERVIPQFLAGVPRAEPRVYNGSNPAEAGWQIAAELRIYSLGLLSRRSGSIRQAFGHSWIVGSSETP